MIRLLHALAGLLLVMRLSGQAPLLPIWTVTLPSSNAPTRLAWDQGMNRLLASYLFSFWPYYFEFEALQADGLPHGSTVPQHRVPPIGDPLNSASYLDRLRVRNDSMVLVTRTTGPAHIRNSTFRTMDVATMEQRMLGTKRTIYDAHWDEHGHVLLDQGSLRTYTTALWPKDTVLYTFQIGASMAVTADRIFVLSPPHVRVYARDTLSNPVFLPIPSSGQVLNERLELQGGVLHYAVMKLGGVLDMGQVDTTGTLRWNRTINLGAGWTLTGLAVDDNASTWVSLAGTTGRLEGTDSTGTIAFTGTWPHPLEDVVSSGDRLFLAGRESVPGPGFVLGWSPDLSTGVPHRERPALHLAPDPATEVIRVDGLIPGNSELEVVDIAGRRCVQAVVRSDGGYDLDVRDLASGHYILRVADPQGLRVAPFMVR